MNQTTVTVIIATAAFILSIFGALQFYASRMEKYIDAKIDGLRGEMRGEIGGLRGEMNARFDGAANESRAEFKAVRAEIETLRAEVRHISDRFKPIAGD